MSSNSFSAIAIGLKGTGKTTYLAALWNHVEQGTVASCAKLAALQPDREYLQTIRGTWLQLIAAQRTSTGTVEHVSLRLEVDGHGSPVELNVPDLSGELFASQWETRQTSKAYAALAQGADGLLLFVHPLAVQPRQRITAAAQSTADSEIKEWAIPFSPTQVQLVDLLQFLTALRGRPKGMRVAVIVSAWDLATDKLSPRDWMERRLPFLFQYLETQGDGFEASYWGVSAQGGRWPEDKQRLQASAPEARPFIVEQLERGTDLALPIRWLLERPSR